MLARLQESKIRYFIAHSASGVGGLQSALSAGLGGCLNASAVPPDVGVFRGVTGLPRMPDVEFNLIAARLGDDTLAAKAIAVLVEQFR